jgi:hypothetical protein
MAPSAECKDDLGDSSFPPLLDMASREIEQVRNKGSGCYPCFPPACLALLRSLDGNHQCLDCGDINPTWAAVRYGALLCLQCSGHHRSLGVKVSCVRSLLMDEWTLGDLLCMLEGGNDQISTFFTRHHLSKESCPQQATTSTTGITKETVTKLRYKTKAAEFYRSHLSLHATKVIGAGPYKGREQSRCQVMRSNNNNTRQLDHRHNTVE